MWLCLLVRVRARVHAHEDTGMLLRRGCEALADSEQTPSPRADSEQIRLAFWICVRFSSHLLLPLDVYFFARFQADLTRIWRCRSCGTACPPRAAQAGRAPAGSSASRRSRATAACRCAGLSVSVSVPVPVSGCLGVCACVPVSVYVRACVRAYACVCGRWGGRGEVTAA